MADENGDVRQAKLADSNLANYGSKAHKDLRKQAAESEKEFKGAGQKVGLEIWRVENRRTADDRPDFGVKRWPVEDYGSFYTGDSYIILNTYKVIEEGKVTDKLAWDVHFWLGNESSQDEIGVAAYKTVELDDLLDDGPVQHRETQGHESHLFQSYFKEIRYMEGGIASGFRHVKPEEYKPRLMQVRRTKKTVRAYEVPCSVKSMNRGDVFVLDAGLKIYVYVGELANAFEKMKGGALQHNIVSSRLGKAKKMTDLDEEFWKIVGGSEKDVGPEIERDDEEPDLDRNKCKLFRLSDSTGKLVFKKEAEGKLSLSMLDPNDVFIVDANIEVFVWVGNRCSAQEKKSALKYADDYLKHEKRPPHIPITQIRQGQVHFMFAAVFEEAKPAAGATAATTATAAGAKATPKKN